MSTVTCPACGNDRETWYRAKTGRHEGFGGPGDCPNCMFAAFGDMYTLRELRDMRQLDDTEQEATRQEYIARYEGGGLHPDVDPGAFTLTVRIGSDGQAYFSDPQPVYVSHTHERGAAQTTKPDQTAKENIK
jgi:hypothetical protein